MRVTVEVKPWLAPLIPRFLANRLKDADGLRRAAAELDYQAIHRFGNTLRGAAGGFGFEVLARVGERIEAAAAARDPDAARACADDLQRCLDTIDVVYR